MLAVRLGVSGLLAALLVCALVPAAFGAMDLLFNETWQREANGNQITGNAGWICRNSAGGVADQNWAQFYDHQARLTRSGNDVDCVHNFTRTWINTSNLSVHWVLNNSASTATYVGFTVCNSSVAGDGKACGENTGNPLRTGHLEWVLTTGDWSADTTAGTFDSGNLAASNGVVEFQFFPVNSTHANFSIFTPGHAFLTSTLTRVAMNPDTVSIGVSTAGGNYVFFDNVSVFKESLFVPPVNETGNQTGNQTAPPASDVGGAIRYLGGLLVWAFLICFWLALVVCTFALHGPHGHTIQLLNVVQLVVGIFGGIISLDVSTPIGIAVIFAAAGIFIGKSLAAD